jgi:hypothetical protein
MPEKGGRLRFRYFRTMPREPSSAATAAICLLPRDTRERLALTVGSCVPRRPVRVSTPPTKDTENRAGLTPNASPEMAKGGRNRPPFVDAGVKCHQSLFTGPLLVRPFQSAFQRRFPVSLFGVAFQCRPFQSTFRCRFSPPTYASRLHNRVSLLEPSSRSDSCLSPSHPDVVSFGFA